MTDHLPPDARAAHDAMLDAFDSFMSGLLKAEGPAAEAKAREEGKTPDQAAPAAQAHVARLMLELQRERARLEADAVLRAFEADRDRLRRVKAA